MKGQFTVLSHQLATAPVLCYFNCGGGEGRVGTLDLV